MLNVTSKLPDIGTSIFAEMSGLANEFKAINLSQGFPNFEVDNHLQNLVFQAMQNGQNQYAPMPGNLALRQAIAKKIEVLYQKQVDPINEITITAGATQAIFTALSAFLHYGDEAIFIEPAYDSYLPSILACGAIPIPIQTLAPDFEVDWDEVESKISNKTKLIIVNSPSNPSAKILEQKDWEKLSVLANQYNLLVVSDEVYEHLIFDEKEHLPAFCIAGLEDRFISIYSFGKTFHATGWKMGYVVAPCHINNEFRKIHQFNVFSVNTPIQDALSIFLQNEENYRNLSRFYQEKRDIMLNLFQNTGLTPLPCSGTYFLSYKFDKISDLSDKAFAIELIKKIGVASIPISAFYHNHLDQKIIRFCFAKTEETIAAAAEKLKDLNPN